jgi:predicted XRE-type DNA-binding protein
MTGERDEGFELDPIEKKDAKEYAGHSRLMGRNLDIYRLHMVQRWPQERIAEHYGITQSTVSHAIKRVRESMDDTTIEKVRARSLELHADLIDRLYRILAMEAPPVTAGKDGFVVTDPDTGKTVRDYSTHLAAMRDALRIDIETRRLMGADAATKTESTASVHYVLRGVNVDDLK